MRAIEPATPDELRALDRQNVAIVVAAVSGYLALLALGSRIDAVFFPLVVFAFAPISILGENIMHVSLHGALHRRAPVNDALGTVVATLLVPMSFVLKREGHHLHHRVNRTNAESFDLILDGDSPFAKRVQWYATLVGLYAFVPPLVTIAIAIAPEQAGRALAQTSLLRPLIESGGWRTVVGRVRREAMAIVAVWAILPFALGLHPGRALVMLVAYALVWSTTQYVGHAFTNRHVVEGAHDLRASRPLAWLLLNAQLERTHHRTPTTRWQLLPTVRDVREPLGHGWFSQYASLWGGPRPSSEPEPEALPDER